MDILSVLIFFLGCFLFIFIERNIQIPFVKWVFIIPFCLIIANRSIYVPDSESYIGYFLSEDPNLLFYADFGFEPGFQTLTKIIKSFVGENYSLYFALITLTNLLIIDFALTRIRNIYCYEHSESPTVEPLNIVVVNVYSILPLTLYVAFFGLYFNAIVLRVGVALSLLILTTSFAIKDNKNIADYFLIVTLLLLAYLFHATAVIGILIVLIILFSKQLTVKTYIWIFLIIGVIYFTNLTSRLGGSVFGLISSINSLSMLSTKLGGYEGDSSMFISEGVSMKFVFYWVMSFVLIRNVCSSKIYYKYLNVYLTGLVLFALFRSVLLVERVTDYFLLFSFIMYYMFLLQQSNHKFWIYFIFIIFPQVVFVLRIINKEVI